MKWRLLNTPHQLQGRVIHLPLEPAQNYLAHLCSLVLFHSRLFNSLEDFWLSSFPVRKYSRVLQVTLPRSLLYFRKIFHPLGRAFLFFILFFSGWLSCSHAQPQSTPIPTNQMLTVTAEMGAFPNGDTPLLPLNGVSC